MQNKYFSTTFLLILLLSISTTPFVSAGTYRFIEDPLVGFQNVSNIIINDTFVPISFFKSQDAAISGIGAYYSINTLLHYGNGEGSHVEGDDLTGSAIGLFGSYAFSERWAIFGLISDIQTSGDATYTAVNGDPTYKGYFDISENIMTSIMFGMAYDFIKDSQTKNISCPLYVMFKHQNNCTYMTYTDTNGDVFNIEDHNDYFNVLVGFAVSFKINDNFRITPYLLVGLLNATTPHITRVSPSEEYDVTIDEGNILQGLEFSFKTDSNFTYGVSFEGTYNEANPITRKIINGLEMKSISLSMGYVF